MTKKKPTGQVTKTEMEGLLKVQAKAIIVLQKKIAVLEKSSPAERAAAWVGAAITIDGKKGTFLGLIIDEQGDHQAVVRLAEEGHGLYLYAVHPSKVQWSKT
jgi:hypothetical protein